MAFLPHKANSRDIVTVDGYPGVLFVIEDWTEEIDHDWNGEVDECVIYSVTNVDNPQQRNVVFDEDIIEIVVPADETPEFLERRRAEAKSPAVFKPSSMTFDIQALMQQYRDSHAEPEPALPDPRVEAARKRRKEQEYLDYLLDRFLGLETLQAVLGEDEERTQSIKMIREEFMRKSAEYSAKR